MYVPRLGDGRDPLVASVASNQRFLERYRALGIEIPDPESLGLPFYEFGGFAAGGGCGFNPPKTAHECAYDPADVPWNFQTLATFGDGGRWFGKTYRPEEDRVHAEIAAGVDLVRYRQEVPDVVWCTYCDRAEVYRSGELADVLPVPASWYPKAELMAAIDQDAAQALAVVGARVGLSGEPPAGRAAIYGAICNAARRWIRTLNGAKKCSWDWWQWKQETHRLIDAAVSGVWEPSTHQTHIEARLAGFHDMGLGPR